MKKSRVAGRVAVYVPGHPGANNRGYVIRARYVVEEHLGRYLTSDEHVHHKNEDKEDDRFENLEIVTPTEHSKIHGSDRRKLDYDLIEKHVKAGLGYKSISKLTGYPVYSVKYAVRLVRGK